MNPNIIRAGAVVLLLLAAWAFGYLVGGSHSPSTSGNSAGSSSATPFPDSASSKSSAPLSATAIGRVIEGKSEFRRQASLHQYAESLDAAAMPGAINEAMQLPLQYRNGALGVLFARWAELDPEAASKYANLLPRSASPYMMRRTAVTAWAEKDFAGALDWALGLEKAEGKNETLSVLSGALAKTDPAAAIKLIKENFSARDTPNAYDNVFSIWAETDFAGALSAAQEIPDLEQRSRVLQATLNKRAETDPRQVLDFARSAKQTNVRWSASSVALRRWLDSDATAAREYVLSLPTGEMRGMQIREVVQDLTRRDPREALRWIDQVTAGDREDAMSALFAAWATKDSKGAIEAARALPDGRSQEKAIAQLIPNLIESERATAIELLNELPSGQDRENALNQVTYRWARTDPAGAAEWYLANSSENQRNALFQVMGEWSRNDPEAALKWAIDLPEMSNKGSLVGQAVAQIARNDPAAAASKIEDLPAAIQKTAVGTFVSQWASRDPQAAVQWLEKIKDPQAKQNAMGSIAGQWANRDPVAAAHWLEKLPPSSARDAAVVSFSQNAAQSDPEGALAWAVTVQNADMNRSAVRNVFTNWQKKDAAAAANWLQSARAISPELRTELQGIGQPKVAR